MSGQVIKAENVIATLKSNSSKNVRVDHWVHEVGGHVVGYGLLDGKMTRIDPQVYTFSEATGEITSSVAMGDNGMPKLSIYKDGMHIYSLSIKYDSLENPLVGAYLS